MDKGNVTTTGESTRQSFTSPAFGNDFGGSFVSTNMRVSPERNLHSRGSSIINNNTTSSNSNDMTDQHQLNVNTGSRLSTTEHVQSLNLMNEGIPSVLDVDCPRPSALVSLSLHSNRVASLEGLASMTVRQESHCAQHTSKG